MNKSKNRWLIFLLCINALLITALVISHVGIPQAHAQVRAYDYILLSGKHQTDTDIVWIIDLGSGQLTSCLYNNNSRRIEYGDIVDLNFEFP